MFIGTAYARKGDDSKPDLKSKILIKTKKDPHPSKNKPETRSNVLTVKTVKLNS
jgi:hypothetical protein